VRTVCSAEEHSHRAKGRSRCNFSAGWGSDLMMSILAAHSMQKRSWKQREREANANR